MLSIVTITFNNFEDLKKTNESLVGLKDIEHIIINGGECKKTIEYLKDYHPSYSFKVISEPDKGIYDAFNKGVQNSSGQWIQFLNSGDRLYSEEYISLACQYLTKNADTSFVHGNIIFEDESIGDILMSPTNRSIGRGLPFQHPSMIVRKTVFQNLNSFDDSYKYSSDFDFVLRLIQKGFIGHYIPYISTVMDGSGVSIKHEWDSIKECYSSLRKNSSLTPIISMTFIERVLFFWLRKVFNLTGLSFFYKALKRLKYKE